MAETRWFVAFQSQPPGNEFYEGLLISSAEDKLTIILHGNWNKSNFLSGNLKRLKLRVVSEPPMVASGLKVCQKKPPATADGSYRLAETCLNSVKAKASNASDSETLLALEKFTSLEKI